MRSRLEENKIEVKFQLKTEGDRRRNAEKLCPLENSEGKTQEKYVR